MQWSHWNRMVGAVEVSTLALALALGANQSFAEPALPSVERLQSSPVLRHLKPNPITSSPKTPAEQTVAQMYLPVGFKAELVLSEPAVHQPIAFAFDERGRIWIAEAYSYPQKQPEGKGRDRIVIYEDTQGNGTFQGPKVFLDGLNLVSGFELGYGGVWIGAAPQLLFVPDRNHDDVPDGPAEVLLDGFGYQDTHECLNSFMWGPDGWLYGNQGVFNYARIGKPGASDKDRTELRAGVWRYHPVRRQFEIFANGGSNPWGLDYDDRGQIFMTHCRSYFGGGCTTHVIQGGQFWNQANANYAPYIIPNPPREFPEFKNYLMASARYDHGAGGAGKPGSDAIYGGHSHVGTLIYQGDNWPDEYRGHLFTHNLGGHQMNHQVNRRLGSGFETVHAGADQFFCSDPRYVPVDLQVGPDGAVYSIDWYDLQHCHNPNTERWDRSNGRVYRMEYAATYKPVKVDLSGMSDDALASLQTHKNEWYVRMARRVLAERAMTRPIATSAQRSLVQMFQKGATAPERLKALWTLHAVGADAPDRIKKAFSDSDEFVRAWAVQLSAEVPNATGSLADALLVRAAKDASPVVRLYAASASQRVRDDSAWKTLDTLAKHSEDEKDRNLPYLLWHSLALRITNHWEEAFRLAGNTTLRPVSDSIYWYASSLGGKPLDRVVSSMARLEPSMLKRRLAGLALALSDRVQMPMPQGWSELVQQSRTLGDIAVQRQIESLASIFGDRSAVPSLQAALANPKADSDLRKHAFAVLSRNADEGSLPVFLQLLDDPAFRMRAIPLVGRFGSPQVARALLERWKSWNPQERAAVLGTLSSRASFAMQLLDAVANGSVPRDQLSTFHVRQMVGLNDVALTQRVTTVWGKWGQTPAAKLALIEKLDKTFSEAPLWAFDGGAGRQHFVKLCAPCHRIGNDGARIGPELTGAGHHGARYFLENIIDPNAVVGADFQVTQIETKKGDVLSGLLVKSSDNAVTLRTLTEELVVPTSDIVKRSTSENSLMPEGLLESLNDREQIELLKFLTSN